MTIRLNNTEFPLTEGLTLHDLLFSRGLHDVKGTAIAVNGTVIPRSKWTIQKLNNNDNILMITASQGG